MNVYIPSRSRYNIPSNTLKYLKRGKIPGERIFLVVPSDQAKPYQRVADKYGGITVLACPLDGIAGTRKFIGQFCDRNGEDKFAMFDDDLRWFYCDPHTRKLHQHTEKHMPLMLRDIESGLDKYAHLAISARQGHQNMPFPLCENRRPLRALAYRTDVFLRAKHGRVSLMEDFDVTLQIMKMGYKNVIITRWSQDQRITQAAGGCSDYRDHALHEENALLLAKLHHPYVTIREQRNKYGGEFGVRTEVTIYWKKAWRSSLSNPLSNPLE